MKRREFTRAPWTPAEDAKLAALLREGLCYRVIGERLGRSRHAVSSRAFAIGLARPVRTPWVPKGGQS